jgi:hypothetical protein
MPSFLLNQQGKFLECDWHFSGEFARLRGGPARFAESEPG